MIPFLDPSSKTSQPPLSDSIGVEDQAHPVFRGNIFNIKQTDDTETTKEKTTFSRNDVGCAFFPNGRPACAAKLLENIEDIHFWPTLSTSLVRSEGSVTRRVILVPLGSIPPPDLTSLVLWPQLSHNVAMITTSLKCGMSGKGKK